MKKHLFFLLALSLVIISCESDTPVEPPERAVPPPFSIKNTGTTISAGQINKIDITLDPEKIETIVFLLDGKEVLSEQANNKLISYQWNTANASLGEHRVDVEATLTSGKKVVKSVKKVVFAGKAPRRVSINILKKFPHDSKAYTQGLEFDGDRLIEGTGQNGASSLRLVDLESGSVLKEIALNAQYFGEGITIFKDEIYQITWRSKQGFIYNKETFELTKKFKFNTKTGEGWGLTHTDEHLIISDGSHHLYFVNPTTFAIERTLQVFTHEAALANLNELEYIDGFIYANIYQRNDVAVIDAKTGAVVELIDMIDLRDQLPPSDIDVLNGIAYNKTTDKWYATGKYWPLLYEIEFN